ncbi:MAG TPA: hypothetical protein DEG43_01670 [Acidimicrobiaceae bacterium]|nr:hypothetical protein [Acidimicrobiaceae bacterium]
MKRLLISLVCGLILASGCATLSNTAALTVDGESLSVKDLNALAASALIKQISASSESPLPSTLAGSLDGSAPRWVAGLYIQTATLKRILTNLGTEVTPEDRSAADESLSGILAGSAQSAPLPQPTSAAKKLLLNYLAAQTAVDRALKDEVPGPSVSDIEAYYADHAEEFAEFICFEGLQVLSEELIATVVASRAAGNSFDDIGNELNAGGEQQAGPLTQDPCVPAAQVTTDNPVGLALALGPLETDTPVSFSDPDRGAFYGVLRVSKRGALTLDDQQVVAQISTALQTEAEQDLAVQAEKLSAEARATIRVELDPRYGTWDPDSPTGIVAPTKPRPERPETTLDPVTVPPQG